MSVALSLLSKLSRLLVVELFCILLAGVLVVPAAAQDISVHFLADYGNVTVMEATGNFDENAPDGTPNIIPRQAVAKEFYRAHKDEYDFVTIFTNFDFKMKSNAVAFYGGVRNDVRGIGTEIFDNSALYGSNGKLQGTIDMGNLLKLATNPLEPKFDFTVDTLMHEMLHRWGAYVKFLDWNGLSSEALLGFDKAHWSFLFDSGGSTLYGNKWRNNGDGTFTSTAVRKYYSPHDLYLMGMIDKSKVPPTLLIENPFINPAQASELGVTISGTARSVTVNDIIAVEGERVPAAKDSQKQFKNAFIYLVTPGTFNLDDLPGIENVRNSYLTRFSILTDGKGLVQVASLPKDNLAINLGVCPPSTAPRSLPPSIDNGIAWLMNRQRLDGSWSDFALTTERDTAESVTTLQRFPIAAQSFQAGFAWLGSNSIANTDYLARRIEAAAQTGSASSALVRELVDRRNRDGGWGSNRNFISNSIDTALALKALAIAGYSDSAVTGPAIAYLQGAQNSDGGWSGDDASSSIQSTAAVLTAFNFYRINRPLDTSLSKAISFLASKQNPDGGFGNSPSTVYDSASAAIALQAAGADKTMVSRGVSYLLGQQSENGDWLDSPYQTAMAVRAVWTAMVDPDLSIKPDDISIIPATITSLPTNAVLSATVWNLGRSDVPQAKIAVYDGIVTSENKVAEQIAAFPGRSAVTLTFSIPVTNSKGHVFHVIADPDNHLVESDENNNHSLKSLLTETTYDFKVQTGDVVVGPNPVEIGKDVKVTVKVANSGTSDAYSVPVRFFIDQPGAPLDVATLAVDIPAGGNVTRDVSWRASLAGVDLPLTVQIDPDNIFSETSKTNNSAVVPLTVNASTLPNLSVSYKDMLITPSPAREGGSVSLSVLVKNDGSSRAENVKVDVFKGVVSNGGMLLGSQLIPFIPAGQSARIAMEWAGIAENGERIISVQLDPDNVIQEISKDDNFAFSTLKILGLPDVDVSPEMMAITPSAPKEGEPVVVTLTVRNLGDQDATNVEILVKEGEAVIGSQVIALLAGNSQVNLKQLYTPLGSGVHQLTAIADPGSRITEKNKQNNVATKAFTAQNARFGLNERYISPNGDGVKDSTQFFFRLDVPTSVTIEISDSQGKVVKNFGGGDLINTQGTTVAWDGKDDGGRVVKDGTYRIVVYGDSRQVLVLESMVVDTNRLPLSSALGASSLLERNITCQLPLDKGTISWLPDESGMVVHLKEAVPPTPEYPAGIYLLSPNGESVIQIQPERWSDNTYDYVLEADSVDIAPGAKSLAFIAWRKERATGKGAHGIWLNDLSGGARRLLFLEVEGSTIHDIEWSPDGKKILFNYGPLYRAGRSHFELAYVDVEQGSKKTIVYGYPLGSSGLHSTAWSPDSTRVAFVQNLFCNAEFTTCNQDYERLMVYDLNGSTSSWKTNNSTSYSYDSINWIDNASLFYDYNSSGNIVLIRDGTATPIVTGAQEYVLSPQGDQLAFVTGASLKVADSRGVITNIHTVSKPALSQASAIINNLLWSPDGRQLSMVEGLNGTMCEYFGKPCPEAYGPNLMTVDLMVGSKESVPVPWSWKNSSYINLLDWLDNGNTILAHDSTYGGGNPLLAVVRPGAVSIQLVPGVSLPGEEGPLLSPAKNYLTYDSWGATRPVDGICRSSLWNSTSVANLMAELQAVKGRQSVTLKGSATDLNFESYVIEYAVADMPTGWKPIVLLSTSPVTNGTFSDWLPPATGDYLVRLTVRDLAGNVASKTIRIAWGTSLSLNSVFKSTDIISPNGDGVQDTVTFEYSVSEAVHLDFVISDESGSAVRTMSAEHPQSQRSSIVWDGRDGQGAVVPDGRYKISVFDYSFSVEVDSTSPQSFIKMGAIKADGREAGYRVELTGRASDKNLTSWAVESGMGDNPQDWLPVSRGNANLVKRDQLGNPVAPEGDALIDSFADIAISSLKGKKFRITAVDRAGNRSTAISDMVEEKTVILSWDGQPTAGVIPPANAAAGTHAVSGFETLRLPVTSQSLQYWNNGIWHDAGNEPPGVEGSVSYVWNSSGLQTGNAYKVRMVAVDQGGRSFTSNELATQTALSLDVTCPSGLFADIALFEEIRSLSLAVHSDQDIRYREWSTYHRRDLPTDQSAFADSLPVPEVSAGMQYQIRMTLFGASGKVYERQVPYPPNCPVSIELGVAYEDAQGCGQTSSGKVTLTAGQKKSYSQARFLKLDYYLVSAAGRKLLQSVDMVREGWQAAVLETVALAEGGYPVEVVVAYFDGNDGKNKQASATGRVLVDRVLPNARLTYPTGSGTTVCPLRVPISGGSRYGISLEGIADDAGGVKRYELSYVPTSGSAAWQPAFAAQTSSQEPGGFRSVPIDGNGTRNGLFGIWDVNDLSGASYTVRLRVIDTAGNSSCTSAGVSFDKVVQVLSLSTDKAIISAFGKPGSDLTASYRIDENANVLASVQRLIERPELPPLPDALPIRTIGSATPYLAGIGTASWNGLNDAGGPVPNGRYAFVVSATDVCGNSGSKWVPVEVDSSPPLATISYPASSSPLLPTTLVDVRGTVSDPHLNSYTLEAGEGDAPATWRTVSSGSREVRDGSLGIWNTHGLSGHWMLRLTASDTVGNTIQPTIGLDLGQRSSLIKSLECAPRLFSPNGDQRLETTSITYQVSDTAVVKIEIVDAFGVIVRELVSGVSAGAGSVVWDGRNSSGAVVADGSYLVRLTASLSTNPAVAQVETIAVVVDGKPPVVEIGKPAEGAHLNTSVLAVSGSVVDQNMDRYSVMLTGPGGIVAQDQGSQNRQSHTFLALAELAEEAYALTVEASDLGQNQTKLVRTFRVDRTPPKVTLDSPKGGEFYGSSKNLVEIDGAIVERNLEHYSLRYGVGDAPSEWKEVAGGDSIPIGLKLSSLKVGKSDSIADGAYTLSLHARDKAGLESEAKAKIVVDNTSPDVSVTFPKDGDYLSKPIDIRGTVADSYFDKGTLELAAGPCASAVKWSAMKTFGSSVRDGLLDSWKTLPADGGYCLKLSATDKSGNTSETKVGFKVDSHPPAAPQLAGKTENKTAISLSWTMSPDPDVAGYNLYRNGQKLNGAPIAGLVYLDPGPMEGSYTYSIKALDFAGNESDASNVVTMKIDLNGPAVRISAPTEGAKMSGLIDIKGTAFSSDDFKEYRVFVGQGSSPSAWTAIRRSPLPIAFGSLAQWDSITYPDGTQLTIKLEGEDLSGNLSSAQVTATVDNTAPQIPVLIAATSNGADVALTWKANIDSDLSGYLLYRNDQLANAKGIVAGNLKPYLLAGTGYPDKSLPDGAYRYYLVAMDQAGNSSAQSNTLEVAIDTHPPHLTIVEPPAGLRFDTKIMLRAESPDNDIATVQFRYKRLQDTAWSDLGAAVARTPFNVYFDPKSLGLVYGDYQLQALAIDRGGKADPAPPVVTLTYQDVTPPQLPLFSTARVNGADVTLAWGAGSETDLAGYNVYRWSSGAKSRLNAATVKDPGYLDAGLPDGNFSYEITAIDIHGNESKPSGPLAARIYAPIIAQPYTPLKAAVLTLEGSGVTPNAPVEITMIQSSGTTKSTLSADSSGLFRLDGISLPLGQSSFRAVATDSAGNISRISEPVVVLYDTSPVAPTGLAASVNGYDVNLTWNVSSETDLIGYNLFRDGVKVNYAVELTGGQASASYEEYYSPSGNAIDGNYSSYWSSPHGYGTFTPGWWQMSLQTPELINRVDIRWKGGWDPANNRYNLLAGKDYEVQAWSGYNWVTLKKVVGNDQQYNTIDIYPSYRTGRVRIVITSTTDQNNSKYVRIEEIRFRKDNLLTTADFTDRGLLDRRYSYAVTAVDSHGFESGTSAPVTVAVGDVEAPAPPTALATTVQGSDVLLSWNPPALEAHDLAYHVYRETPAGWKHLEAVPLSSPTYTDQKLANGTYRYRVTATDTANNESSPSNESEATVRIAIPPAPVLLVSSPVSGGVLDLAWQTPPGNGQYTYLVHRSLNEAGPFNRLTSSAITSNSFRDSGLGNGSVYFYRVTALDRFGNEGEPSNVAMGVPRDRIAVRPTILGPTVSGTSLVTRDAGGYVSGLAEPGDRIDLIREGSLVGSDTALTDELQTDLAMAIESQELSLSPDGKLMAYHRNSQLLTLLDMQNNAVKNISSGLSYIRGVPQWSPSGRFLLLSGYDPYGQQKIAIYDRDVSTIKIVATAETRSEFGQSWSLKEDAFVFAGRSGDGKTGLWINKPADGSNIRVVDLNDASEPRLSPDGTRVAYFAGEALYVYSQTDYLTTMVDDNNDQSTLAWSPDGTKLAYLSYHDGDGDIYIYDAASGAVTRKTASQKNGDRVAWSPDGSQLGYISYPDSDELFNIVDGNGSEKVVFSAAGEMYGAPEWRANGELIFFDRFGLHRVQPPGYFSVWVDKLLPGVNRLAAVASDNSGNRSMPSDSVSVILDTGLLPDLAIADSELTFFPPYPKPGEEVLVTARVHNPTDNPADNITVSLYRWDGSEEVTLLKAETIPHLDANGEGSVSIRFNAGAAAGSSTIIAVVDPADLIHELDESNNHVARDLIVNDQERVSISSSISPLQYGANQDASIGVTLMNSGLAASGVLKIMIEDSRGNLVKLLASQPQELPYALNQKLAYTWNTATTYAGSYRLRVLITNDAGAATLAENTILFDILPDLKVSGNVTTDKLSYGPGESAVVRVAFTNSGVNYVIPQLKARVQIVDALNNQLFGEERHFASLLPANGASFSSSWNTGTLPAGIYTAVMDLSAGDQSLVSKSVTFKILPQLRLQGNLSVDTVAVLPGRSFTASYHLSNQGNGSAAGTVRVNLQDPDLQTIVASTEQSAAIMAGGSRSGSVVFDTTGLELKTYRVVLAFKTDIIWQNIAMATVAVRDGIAPTIKIISPLEGEAYASDVGFTVVASDDLSGVEKVEFRIDNGTWKTLSLVDVSLGRYSSSWTPALVDNGSHSVSFRAIDRTGNITLPVSVNFEVQNDTAPPVLTLSTLPDGSYTNNEVLNISGTVTDNVGVKELMVNGLQVPFGPDGKFSLALLLKPGENMVQLKALDLADNPFESNLTFYLDKQAPLLVVNSPADNSMTNQPLIDVSGYVDEFSTVHVSLNGVPQPVIINGNAFVSAVALTPGSEANTITIAAIDRAGNSGSDKRTVYYDDQLPSLAITEPGQDVRSNRAHLTVRGSASDPYGFGVTVRVEVDGQQFTPPLVNGSFEQPLTFTSEGTYQVLAVAINGAGNSSSVRRNFIYDITPPALTINPVESPTVADRQIVGGTRESGVLVVVTCLTATIGDISYPSATTWQASVTSLKPGSNIVTVSSSDNANNSTTVSAEIVYTAATSKGVFSAAIFGNSCVTISGNSYTDSYINSPSSWIRGKYKNGDVGTNSLQACGIQMNGGTRVFGKVWVGQAGDPVTGACMDGDSSVFAGSAALGTAKDMTPKSDPPGGVSIGAIQLTGTGTRSLPAGDYRVSAITLGGNSTLDLNGPLTLHVDGDFSLSGNSSIITSGDVTIYQNGRKLLISGGSIVNANKAPDSLVIYGTAGLQAVSLSGNSDLHALVYAPTASVKLSGGQSIFGSIIGNTVDISGGSSVHYDESLGNLAR